MKPADKTGTEPAKTTEPEKEEPKPISPVDEIKANIALIDRAVATLEPRFTHRVLRTLSALRKTLSDAVLRDAIEGVYPARMSKSCSVVEVKTLTRLTESPIRSALLSWLPKAPLLDHSMEVDTTSTPAKPTPVTQEPVPEAEIYLRLLMLHHLQSEAANYAKSIELAHETVDKMQTLNRRSMDPIAAKIWFAVERAYELGGELADARP